MSRAFVKESDGDPPDDGLPERQESDNPNYVTPSGLHDLKRQLDEAQAQLRLLKAPDGDLATKAPRARLAREIRYLRRRIDDAIVVEAKDGGEIGLGATVTIDDGESRRTFTIVGEDQANPVEGMISWTSPLGHALMGARPSEKVVWQRPAGDITVTIVDVRT